MVAVSRLTELVTLNFDDLEGAQVAELRTSLVTYLFQHGQAVPKYLAASLSKLVCAITKRGWSLTVSHHDLIKSLQDRCFGTPEDVSAASYCCVVRHSLTVLSCVVQALSALSMLNELVLEIAPRSGGRRGGARRRRRWSR